MKKKKNTAVRYNVLLNFELYTPWFDIKLGHLFQNKYQNANFPTAAWNFGICVCFSQNCLAYVLFENAESGYVCI